MTERAQLELHGLDGTNPLGFLAGMGAAAAVRRAGADVRLSWTATPIPVAVLTGVSDRDVLVESLLRELEAWRSCWIVQSELADVKLTPEELRDFLSDARRADERSAQLSQALVAEGSLDRSGVAKPTDFHFTAGQQKWLVMARKVIEGLEPDDLKRALFGPWEYPSKLPSLMWDTADDRQYALSAVNPASDTKLTEPGAEWLALNGLPFLPVLAGDDRTLTPGCRGSWKSGWFRWPLWRSPMTPRGAASLVAASAISELDTKPERVDGLGVERVLECEIRRSDQGGYGTFGPPRVVWQNTAAASPVPV